MGTVSRQEYVSNSPMHHRELLNGIVDLSDLSTRTLILINLIRSLVRIFFCFSRGLLVP